MDYTKDAILIHEGFKPLEEPEDRNDDNHRQTYETFSILTLMNGSEYIEKKIMTVHTQPEESSVFASAGNGSLSLSSPFPPIFDENDMNDTYEYIPYSMRPETYIVPVLFAIIFIIGVIGNGTLIVIFIKHRSMRNVPNMFIVSLAIGDLLVILFCVPFTSTLYTVDSWPYGLLVCKFSEFIKHVSVGVSVFTLTALSADRYFAIVDPMRKLTGRRATRITIISIIGIWTLSVLVALPSAIYSYIRKFPDSDEEEDEEDNGRTFLVCYPYPKEFGKIYAQVMVMFHFLVYYAVPLAFIATFYVIMARHLVLSTRNMPGEATGQAKQIQARKKVAKMILSFVVIFAICFFPQHLFLLFFYFYPDAENNFNDFWNICRIVGFCLSFTNSCINPITLYCVSGTFRKQFNDHLFCCICNDSGNRQIRGGRMSGGGTMNGGGGGGGGRGGGLCAACVSLSGNNGQPQGNDRYTNGSLGRGGNGRIHRDSTTNSDRMISKRKSTWDTQTTVVNHRVLNMVGNPGANIHVNLCSEHEHIPLKNMSKTAYLKSNMRSSDAMSNASEEHALCNHHDSVHHKRRHSASAASTTSSFSSHGHGRTNSSGTGNSSIKFKRPHNKAFISTYSNPHSAEYGMHPEKFPYGPRLHESCIEEETENSSNSEKEKSIKNSLVLSPTKSCTKVGEIISKISNKCTSSPSHTQKFFTSENSSPSKKSPGKNSIFAEEIPNSLQSNELDVNIEMNYNNNNNYSDDKKQAPESLDDCTLTTLIVGLEQGPLGSNLEGNAGKVIVCNN